MPVKRKRAKISDENRALIIQYSLEPPRIPRTKLAEQLLTRIDWEGIEPEVEVLERYISWFRNHALDEPEEKPWSMATLEDYPIPPDALPVVLEVWKHRIEQKLVFTIREAKWTSRLYAVMKNNRDSLPLVASRYAHTELAHHMMKRSFDSTGLDRLLMGLPLKSKWGKSLKDILPYLGEKEKGIEELRNRIEDPKYKKSNSKDTR